MKKRLASLGFAMALEPVPNFGGPAANDLGHDIGTDGGHYGDSGASMRKTTSSHTAGRSAHTTGNAAAPSSPLMQRPMKRQRVDSPLPAKLYVDPPTSRDAMPPPQKPVSRMRSVRKIFPTLRKKFAGGRSTPAPEVQCSNDDDVGMYEDEYSAQPQAQHDYRDDAPYMSGALPVERPSHASDNRASQLLSSVGIDSERPDFTFRASSPVKMSQQSSHHQPVQLPTEPSYIRLMDGLSRDNGMELGLKDPRDDGRSSYQTSEHNRQVASYDKDRHRYEESGGQEDWSLGPSSHRQIPNGPYFSAGSYLDSPQYTRTDKYHDRPSQGWAPNPVTPAPRRHQQPSPQIESVVSPHVQNSNHVISRISRHRIAEPQDSSHHSVASRSPGPQKVGPESHWQPRGLNGLSFFESPVLSRRPPVPHSYQRQQSNRPPPSSQYQSRNLDPDGFITRPEAGQSPFFRDSAYGSSRERPIYSRQQHTQPKGTILFPSFSRSSYPRAGQAPSAMPSIVSGRSPVRTQPQWQALQRMGVRSSRHEFSGVAGSTYAGSTSNLFPSAGRRSVRR